MKYEKPLIAILNSVGGYDLLTERDTGNRVLCLTGKPSLSIEYWKRLKQLSEDVIKAIETHPEFSPKEIHR